MSTAHTRTHTHAHAHTHTHTQSTAEHPHKSPLCRAARSGGNASHPACASSVPPDLLSGREPPKESVSCAVDRCLPALLRSVRRCTAQKFSWEYHTPWQNYTCTVEGQEKTRARVTSDLPLELLRECLKLSPTRCAGRRRTARGLCAAARSRPCDGGLAALARYHSGVGSTAPCAGRARRAATHNLVLCLP